MEALQPDSSESQKYHGVQWEQDWIIAKCRLKINYIFINFKTIIHDIPS